MPATAPDATRAHPGPESTDRELAVPEDRDREALQWSEVIRLLAATDEDDVPLFGRLPA
jgi:hypothetical protein